MNLLHTEFHFLQVLLRLLIPCVYDPYFQFCYNYIIIMPWLVGWFRDQGKKGVCIGKKVHCGPVSRCNAQLPTVQDTYQASPTVLGDREMGAAILCI